MPELLNKYVVTSIGEQVNLFLSSESGLFVSDYMKEAEGLVSPIDYLYRSMRVFLRNTSMMSEANKIHSTVQQQIDYLTRLTAKYPSIGEREFVFRNYHIDHSADLKDYLISIQNVSNRAVLSVSNKRLYELMKAYTMSIGYEDTNYKAKIKDVIPYLTEEYEKMGNLIESMRKDLNASENKVKAIENEPGIVDALRCFFTGIVNHIVNAFDRFTMNIDMMSYEIKRLLKIQVVENHSKVSIKSTGKDRDAEYDAIMKDAKFLQKYEMFGMKFDIYTIDEFACFNYEGVKIYLTKDIFNYPKGMQKAILYHEIGHMASGHFAHSHETMNEKEKIKKIRSLMAYFDSMVSQSDFSPTKSLNDDTELLYILRELDADSFAAKYVGKSMMRKSLNRFMQDHLAKTCNLKNKDDKLNYLFNMERTKFRTALL